MSSFILYETASGVQVYSCQSVEDLTNAKDINAAERSLSLVASTPFASIDETSAYASDVAENKVPKLLTQLLGKSVPEHAVLIVFEPELKDLLLNSYDTEFNIAVFRILQKFFPEPEAELELALSHSFSRGICKFDAALDDQEIVQAIGLYETLIESTNKYEMRLGECFGLHYPELRKMCKDGDEYVILVKCIGNRSKLTAIDHFCEEVEKLYSMLGFEGEFDEVLLTTAFNGARTSTGCEFKEQEETACSSLAGIAIDILHEKQDITTFISNKLSLIAPSSQELLGTIETARLISKAGSLRNLAKSPASTIQLLGAEKALFRALKKRSKKTPKYGILYNAGFVVNTKNFKSKGRTARTLACAFARCCRVDLYSTKKTTAYGKEMRKLLESRVAFYNGETKKIVKNMDLIREMKKQ